MKRFILVLFMLITISEKGFSQILLGVKGGPTYSTFQGADGAYVSGKNFSFFFDAPPDNHFRISGELSLAQKGGMLNDLVLMDPPVSNLYFFSIADMDVKTKYLEFSLLMKQKYRLSKNVEMYPYFGYTFSYPISDDTQLINVTKIRDNETLIPYDVTGHYELQTGNILHSISIGGSLTYRRLLLDARYFHSLNRVDGVYYYRPFPYKPHGFDFSIGFILTRDWKKTNKGK